MVGCISPCRRCVWSPGTLGIGFCSPEDPNPNDSRRLLWSVNGSAKGSATRSPGDRPRAAISLSKGFRVRGVGLDVTRSKRGK